MVSPTISRFLRLANVPATGKITQLARERQQVKPVRESWLPIA